MDEVGLIHFYLCKRYR